MLTRGVCAAAAATLLLPAVHGQAATGVKGEEPSVDIHTTQISAQALSDRQQYETYEVRTSLCSCRSWSAAEMRCCWNPGLHASTSPRRTHRRINFEYIKIEYIILN